jgi:hypothetical protein
VLVTDLLFCCDSSTVPTTEFVLVESPAFGLVCIGCKALISLLLIKAGCGTFLHYVYLYSCLELTSLDGQQHISHFLIFTTEHAKLDSYTLVSLLNSVYPAIY